MSRLFVSFCSGSIKPHFSSRYFSKKNIFQFIFFLYFYFFSSMDWLSTHLAWVSAASPEKLGLGLLAKLMSCWAVSPEKAWAWAISGGVVNLPHLRLEARLIQWSGHEQSPVQPDYCSHVVNNNQGYMKEIMISKNGRFSSMMNGVSINTVR